MDQFDLTTPVLLIVFNRPDTTARVFDAIRAVAPRRLYVAADGPRPKVSGEAERCQRVREIVGEVDWPCEVKTLFRETNQGCRLGASGAVSWFFEHEPEGIVLEDDCLPDASFFRFCQELLEHYRDDRRVMHIGGTSLLAAGKVNTYSYYFSRYPVLWGWASWRRAWALYDLEMKLWPMAEKGLLERVFEDRREARYWGQWCRQVYSGKLDTWDYQWNLVNWLNSGLTATPNVNLISNIGFANQATHTHDASSKYAAMPLERVEFPLSHPPYVVRDIKADRATFKHHYLGTLPTRIWRKLKRMARPARIGIS